MVLHNLQFGSSTGEAIPAEPRKVVIVVEERLTTGDINRDGQVSILDIILIAKHLGETAPTNSEVDVNGDGVVSILDLILVAQHMDKPAAAAPSTIAAMKERRTKSRDDTVIGSNRHTLKMTVPLLSERVSLSFKAF